MSQLNSTRLLLDLLRLPTQYAVATQPQSLQLSLPVALGAIDYRESTVLHRLLLPLS